MNDSIGVVNVDDNATEKHDDVMLQEGHSFFLSRMVRIRLGTCKCESRIE